LATVLVVEDEPELCTVVAELLTEQGYEVMTAANAEEALTCARACPRAIDLLMTDLMIGGPGQMTGKELSEVLLREQPDLCVLYVSGHGAHAFGDLDGASPPRRFMHKPYRAHELTAQLDHLLRARG
jgi:two-component system cell cycle sensor histidine kinase/response regulator CckA